MVFNPKPFATGSENAASRQWAPVAQSQKSLFLATFSYDSSVIVMHLLVLFGHLKSASNFRVYGFSSDQHGTLA
jgi:hypothetical protein